MFGLFKKSPAGVKVIDKVWLSKKAKWKACAQMKQLNPDILLVAWFDETAAEISGIEEISGNSILARDLTFDKLQGRMVVFAEHYPLASVEQAMFSALRLSDVPVLSSLEDHLLFRLGAIEMIKKLAGGEDEIIAHSLVTKSIRNAQEKIATQTRSDYAATSCREWFKLNMNE